MCCLDPILRHTWELSSEQRRAIRELMDIAFRGDFDDADFDHALGGIHVIVDDGARGVVGHASVVQRQLLVDGRPLRAGYVEAVAVHPDQGRRGIGGAVMAAIETVIAGAYDLGALSASEQGAGLYRRRGWRVWSGELGVLAPEGYRTTPGDVGSVMVWGAGVIDLSGSLACDWRAGPLW